MFISSMSPLKNVYIDLCLSVFGVTSSRVTFRSLHVPPIGSGQRSQRPRRAWIRRSLKLKRQARAALERSSRDIIKRFKLPSMSFDMIRPMRPTGSMYENQCYVTRVTCEQEKCWPGQLPRFDLRNRLRSPPRAIHSPEVAPPSPGIGSENLSGSLI